MEEKTQYKKIGGNPYLNKLQRVGSLRVPEIEPS